MSMGRRLFAGLLVSALSTFGFVAANAGSAAAADCGYLFDDFHYASSADPALTANGWTPRTYQGGPGVPGANWSASAITFPTSGGQKVMQLTASTDGTAAGTKHAELYSTQKRYLEGTYASRVRFTDAPVSGNDGDHINQTFFTISPLNGDMDPTYSELDISEYLPNGGWGETGPINYQTTWYTYRADPGTPTTCTRRSGPAWTAGTTWSPRWRTGRSSTTSTACRSGCTAASTSRGRR